MSPDAPAVFADLTPPPKWRWARVAVVAVAQALALLGLDRWLDTVSIDTALTALVVVGVLAVLNGFVWPLTVRFALPLIVVTAGLFAFVLNAAFVALSAELIDGFRVGSLWSGLVVAFVMALVNLVVGGLLSIDDDHVWRQTVVRRMVARREPAPTTDEPGILFIQIDGLGADVLEEAMASGHAPLLASLVRTGSHRLLRWECDLSSQTGAMQAGIMFGDNSDMPAFRWYEKDTGRVLVSNRPHDAAEIEQRQSNGDGLLVDGGASRGNVFSGDATDAMFTFSRIFTGSVRGNRFVYVVATPFAMARIIWLTLADIIRELRAARRARRTGVEPSVHRGGVYPLLRAATTVVLAEVTYGVLIADVERGVPSAYADLVGYDEVAHHSGIQAPESLDTLRRIDDELRRLLSVLADAPRQYHVVFLSDHGQTQGAPFSQRYGETLEDLVRRLVGEVDVIAPVLAEEGWNNLNGLLSDAATEETRLGKAVAVATKAQSVDGEVKFGPDTDTEIGTDHDVVVLASGNLGLLSFPEIEGRATRAEIDHRHPGLIAELVGHEGIGWVLVRDEDGDVVIGGDGVRHLRDDRVEGEDPLAAFGPNAADHLRRTSGFSNCPDIVVNSFYDPVADEGAAFEEQAGFHGGMGGKQSHPFVLAPTALPAPDAELVGAEAIHHLFKGWLRQIQAAPIGP